MNYSEKIKHWDDIHVGDVESFTKTMTETDMILWVGLTGDMNPVHIDKQYAATTRFKDVIVPGLLVAGLISTVMTQSTFGNVYSGQTLKFLKPVYVGDTLLDHKSAAEAGLPFIFAAYGFGTVENTPSIESLAELPGLLDTMEA